MRQGDKTFRHRPMLFWYTKVFLFDSATARTQWAKFSLKTFQNTKYNSVFQTVFLLKRCVMIIF